MIDCPRCGIVKPEHQCQSTYVQRLHAENEQLRARLAAQQPPDDAVLAAALRLESDHKLYFEDSHDERCKDTMTVVRWILAARGGTGDGGAEIERLKRALRIAEKVLNNCAFVDSLTRQRSHEGALGVLRAALSTPPRAAPGEGEEDREFSGPNTCAGCGEDVPLHEMYSHHRWCGVEAVSPAPTDPAP